MSEPAGGSDAAGLARLRLGGDIERLDGGRVEAVGRYEAIANPRKGPPAADAKRDHAVIVLVDETRLYLDALGSPAARRPRAELEDFDGLQVRVVGTVRRQMPATGATLLAPCLEEATVVGIAASPDAAGAGES
jgi:hypothetical protein